jgi:2-hydroxy-3-keto-5-methylthiopentenyl-1-phosphate phosphatase
MIEELARLSGSSVPRPGWVVQCDFDGTISAEDVTDTLLQRFGLDGWQALEAAWERGEIGSRECMKGQAALLDMSNSEFMAHLDGMAVDPHFASFVEAARQSGIAVQVVSDGFDRAIHHMLGRNGVGGLPVFANRLRQVGERRWRLSPLHADSRCVRASGNCKCARAAEQQAASQKVLFIGDGSSDFCVSGQVDMVLAKSSLVGHCQAAGIAHRRFEDFKEARELMLELTAVVTS